MKKVWLALLFLFIVTACAPQVEDDVIPPQAPAAPGQENIGGQATLSEMDFRNSANLRERFAPPYDVWNDNYYVVQVPWNAVLGQPNYLYYTFSEESNRKLVYDTVYVLHAETNKWKPLKLQGEQSKYASFLEEVEQRTIPPDYIGVGDNYIATYVCTDTVPVTYRGGLKSAYACGCAEDDLDSCGRWNLQRLSVQKPAVCGDDMCTTGEYPWTCESDCLTGPQAPQKLAEQSGAIDADYCVMYGGMNCSGYTLMRENMKLRVQNLFGTPISIVKFAGQDINSPSDCTFTGSTGFFTDETTIIASCEPNLEENGPAVEMYFEIQYSFEWDPDTTYSDWGFLRAPVTPSDRIEREDEAEITLAFGDERIGLIIPEGQTIANASVGGRVYEVTNLLVGKGAKVKLLINGETTPALTEGQSASLSDKAVVSIDGVTVNDNRETANDLVTFELTDASGMIVGDMMAAGEAKTYDVNGREFEVAVWYTYDWEGSQASFMVNGIYVGGLKAGEEAELTDGVKLRVTEVLINDGYKGACQDTDGTDYSKAGSTANAVWEISDWCNLYEGDNVLYESACAVGDQPTQVRVLCEGSTPYCKRGACSAEAPQCSDTDGNDPYTEGWVTADFADSEYPPRWLDNCAQKEITDYGYEYYNWANSCSGSNCYVEEIICEGFLPGQTYVQCEFGCSNGACLNQSIVYGEWIAVGEGVQLWDTEYALTYNGYNADEQYVEMTFTGSTASYSYSVDGATATFSIFAAGKTYPAQLDLTTGLMRTVGSKTDIVYGEWIALEESVQLDGTSDVLKYMYWNKDDEYVEFSSDAGLTGFTYSSTDGITGSFQIILGGKSYPAQIDLQGGNIRTIGSKVVELLSYAEFYVGQDVVEMEEEGLTVNGEFIEDISFSYRENDGIEMLQYTLDSDAAIRSGIYLGAGENMRAALDEPEGAFGYDIKVDSIGPEGASITVTTEATGNVKVPVNGSLAALYPGADSMGSIRGSQYTSRTVMNSGSDARHLSVIHDENNGDVLGHYLFLGDGEPVFTNTIEFSPAYQPLAGDHVPLMNKMYSVVDASNAFILCGNCVTDTLTVGETKTYEINGEEYEVTVLVISSNGQTKFLVNGEATDTIMQGEKDTLSDGTIIGLRTLSTTIRPDQPESPMPGGAVIG